MTVTRSRSSSSVLNRVASFSLVQREADRRSKQIVHVREGFRLKVGHRLAGGSWSVWEMGDNALLGDA